jgi:hypothetical protein
MAALVCPAGHASSHDVQERFCRECGLPLVLADVTPPPLTDRRERARKVLPQYGEGELVKVGWARNQPEAELISGMLLEEGIPSVAKRSGGFDVPDFLAAGPRDILVAASGADAAREVLGTPPPAPAAAREREPSPRWVRAMAIVLVTVTVGLVLAGLLTALLS